LKPKQLHVQGQYLPSQLNHTDRNLLSLLEKGRKEVARKRKEDRVNKIINSANLQDQA